MKKLSLFAIIALFAVTACNKEPSLTFMVGGADNELDYWQSVLSNFTVETGIEVELIRQSSDTEQRKQGIMMALQGQLADPDVMMMDVAWIGQIAAAGWLEDISTYDTIDSTVFFPNIIAQADMYDGMLIGVPVYVDGGLLYYRTDLLTKYGYDGPPETWDELLDMAVTVQEGEKAENDNFWGYVWQGAQYEGMICAALEAFYSFGGAFFDEGIPEFDSPENAAAMEFLTSLIHEYKVSPPDTYTAKKENEVLQVFQNGNALFERNWPYAYAVHTADDSVIRDVVAVYPLPHVEGQSSASTLGGWHAGLSMFSDMKDEAVQLIEYITSYDVQKDMALNLGWNPGRMGVYNDQEVMTLTPHLVTFRDVFVNAIPRPTLPYYSEVSTVLQKNLNAILAQDGDAADLLRESQEEIEEIVSEYESE